MSFLSTQLTDLFLAIRRSDIKQIKKLLFIDSSSEQENDESQRPTKAMTLVDNSKIMETLSSVRAGQSQPVEASYTPYESVAPTLFAYKNTASKTQVGLFPLDSSLPDVADTPNYLSLSYEPVPASLAASPAQLPAQLPASPPVAPQHSQGLNDTDAWKKAVCSNDIRAVEALLKAKVSFKPENWYDPSLLVIAAENGYSDIVQALLDAGDDPNKGYDRLPLHVAAENGHLETVQRLLNSGAQLHAKEEGGQTALMRAAAGGHVLVVQVLIDKGANINAVCKGETALMLAAKNGHREVYEFLYPYLRARGMLVHEQAQQQRAILAAESAHFKNELAALFESNEQLQQR